MRLDLGLLSGAWGCTIYALCYAQVTDCYFPRDKYLNRRKNFCFVTFATQQVRLSDKMATLRRHLYCSQGSTGVCQKGFLMQKCT